MHIYVCMKYLEITSQFATNIDFIFIFICLVNLHKHISFILYNMQYEQISSRNEK